MFFPFAVKLVIKNLLPCAEVKPALGYRTDYLTPHNSSFEVSIGVILEAVVSVSFVRKLGSKSLQPVLKVIVQTGLIIIYKYA